MFYHQGTVVKPAKAGTQLTFVRISQSHTATVLGITTLQTWQREMNKEATSKPMKGCSKVPQIA